MLDFGYYRFNRYIVECKFAPLVDVGFLAVDLIDT